jgi:anti-sigma factor RsiW
VSCDFSHDDGAYVLGALAPGDRLAFERHLPGCADCARSVQELAGLPGLLGRVPVETLETPTADEPVPDTLLPALVREVRRVQQRRVRLTAVLATAAAVAVTVGGVTIVRAVDDGNPSATPSAGVSVSSAPARPMVPVGTDEMTASLALTSVAWGTRLDLTCDYEADGYEEAGGATYALVVRTRDGRVEQVATWRGLPGRTMQLDAATATRREDIASVEVRTADGDRVLTLAG